jgi:SAM-dependent methyltransferase
MSHPEVSLKQLARMSELQGPEFSKIMAQINGVARRCGLQEYDTYSRIWEYPWVWLQLKALKGRKIRVLDVGSERSPFSWFLSTQGFDVTVSDVTANYWRFWQRASQQLGVAVNKCVLDAEKLNFSTSSVDIYLSVSVIEHVRHKVKAITEAARVLKPGGLLILTFDICEPDMGMTFPEWNGRALSMREFDELFCRSPWFKTEVSQLPWNTKDILEYLFWNRTTAVHHNYVTGAAVVQRNDVIWPEPAWKGLFYTLRRKSRIASSVAVWSGLYYLKALISSFRRVSIR